MVLEKGPMSRHHMPINCALTIYFEKKILISTKGALYCIKILILN